MIVRILFFLCCLLCFSCGNKLLEEPENLIPKTQMVDILYDLALLNAIDNSHPQELVASDVRVMDFIFKKYEIDSVQYVQSNSYYASVPEEYRKIYEEVEARLTKERDSVSMAMQESKTTSGDSIPANEDYD